MVALASWALAVYHPGTMKYLPARAHVILTVKGGRCVFLILRVRKMAQYVCCLPRVTELVSGWPWMQPVCLIGKPALLLINRPTPLFRDTAQHILQDVLLRVCVLCIRHGVPSFSRKDDWANIHGSETSSWGPGSFRETLTHLLPRKSVSCHLLFLTCFFGVEFVFSENDLELNHWAHWKCYEIQNSVCFLTKQEDYIETDDKKFFPLRWTAPELVTSFQDRLLTADQTKYSNIWYV